jgi:hypothetical protein
MNNNNSHNKPSKHPANNSTEHYYPSITQEDSSDLERQTLIPDTRRQFDVKRRGAGVNKAKARSYTDNMTLLVVVFGSSFIILKSIVSFSFTTYHNGPGEFPTGALSSLAKIAAHQ